MKPQIDDTVILLYFIDCMNNIKIPYTRGDNTSLRRRGRLATNVAAVANAHETVQDWNTSVV